MPNNFQHILEEAYCLFLLVQTMIDDSEIVPRFLPTGVHPQGMLELTLRFTQITQSLLCHTLVVSQLGIVVIDLQTPLIDLQSFLVSVEILVDNTQVIVHRDKSRIYFESPLVVADSLGVAL